MAGPQRGNMKLPQQSPGLAVVPNFSKHEWHAPAAWETFPETLGLQLSSKKLINARTVVRSVEGAGAVHS
jgi:hypothetical protein